MLGTITKINQNKTKDGTLSDKYFTIHVLYENGEVAKLQATVEDVRNFFGDPSKIDYKNNRYEVTSYWNTTQYGKSENLKYAFKK